MEKQTFNQWLYEGERYEALQDIYFEDRMGAGSEFLKWAESVYKARQAPPVEGQRPRLWPFN